MDEGSINYARKENCRSSESRIESHVQDGPLASYPELLTVQHICEITGLSAQTVRSEINAGHLPGCRIGRRLYVPKPNFVKYVTEGGGLNG